MYSEEHANKLVDAYHRACHVVSANASLKILSMAFEEVIAAEISTPKIPTPSAKERAEQEYSEIKAMDACKDLDGVINTLVHNHSGLLPIRIQQAFWKFVEDLQTQRAAYLRGREEAKGIAVLKDYLKHVYEIICENDPDWLTDEMHNNINRVLKP